MRQPCPDCGRPVIVARTEVHGLRLFLDPEPDPAGNQAVMQPPAGPLQTRQLNLSKGEKPRPYETQYMPHVATCPKRKQQQAPAAPVPLPPGVIPIDRARQRGY